MIFEYTRTNITFVGSVVLMPGMNEVTAAAIKRFTKTEKMAWDRYLEEGDLREVKSKSNVTVKMVKQTSDLEVLKKWETDAAIKGPVKGAIRKQIAEIESVVDEIQAKQAEEVL